jgi:hypothetical protein
MRKGDIQPGSERWCYGKCGTTTFHFAARSDGRQMVDRDPTGKGARQQNGGRMKLRKSLL